MYLLCGTMPRLPKGKKLLQAYVDEELLKEFKELAFCKHRRLRGALSWEVEEALKNWLALHDITKIEKSVLSFRKKLKLLKDWSFNVNQLHLCLVDSALSIWTLHGTIWYNKYRDHVKWHFNKQTDII